MGDQGSGLARSRRLAAFLGRVVNLPELMTRDHCKELVICKGSKPGEKMDLSLGLKVKFESSLPSDVYFVLQPGVKPAELIVT